MQCDAKQRLWLAATPKLSLAPNLCRAHVQAPAQLSQTQQWQRRRQRPRRSRCGHLCQHPASVHTNTPRLKPTAIPLLLPPMLMVMTRMMMKRRRRSAPAATSGARCSRPPVQFAVAGTTSALNVALRKAATEVGQLRQPVTLVAESKPS